MQSYYTHVDRNDFQHFSKIFTEGIIYHRAEHTIIGLKNLIKFYNSERRIVGTHFIDSIFESQNTLIVLGRFTGVNSNSNSIIIDFADFFYFDDKSSLISQRKTYLANGYELTK
ncbi:nuclear transport factor 2 family protein [Spirosoma profusum]|uniref:nuclear transport factor 2 family protein n=1 Tax=Spirosoma profusum TaxID=2771354 RepID=UPI0016895290|nr:nuclear transport factor 2 family protein [Spirosoma profusum]